MELGYILRTDSLMTIVFTVYTFVYKQTKFFGGYIGSLSICPYFLMKLNTVVVYNLRMCMKDDNHGPTNIQGDYSREIIICAGQRYPL